LNETPLHLAAKLESCSINKLEALLNRINPEKVLNIPDLFGYTPLHYAVDVRLPNEKKIKLLLDKGADINSKTKKGYTALHFALWHKSATVTIELLSHVKLVDGKDVEDADVNSMDDYNQTALHYACWWSGIPVGLFKKILEKTTDMNGKDQLGYTGLIIALFCKNKVATEELLTHSRTLVDGTEECVDINIRNNDDETALHWASAWPNIPEKLFQKILDGSADFQTKDCCGTTPIDIANKYKSLTAQFLLGKQCKK
jgi:ankyrin repeat protein